MNIELNYRLRMVNSSVTATFGDFLGDRFKVRVFFFEFLWTRGPMTHQHLLIFSMPKTDNYRDPLHFLVMKTDCYFIFRAQKKYYKKVSVLYCKFFWRGTSLL